MTAYKLFVTGEIQHLAPQDQTCYMSGQCYEACSVGSQILLHDKHSQQGRPGVGTIDSSRARTSSNLDSTGLNGAQPIEA